MNRYVLMVDLKHDAAVAEYREHHRRVWPEVVASLERAGVREMDIHLLGRRLVMLVAVQDGFDFKRILAAHAASSPRVAEWEALMQSLQQRAPGAEPDEWWALMKPVFRLEDRRTTSAAASGRGPRG